LGGSIRLSSEAVLPDGQKEKSRSTRLRSWRPGRCTIRRTVRTGMGMLGVLPHVAEAALNHLPPKLIRTYDRNTYAAEKRAALDLWAGHLKVAIAQATGANVTALRQSQ
jgi:hypothetical protein